MTWINFLHFYQPPVSSDAEIHQVVKDSYQSWIDFLNKHPKIKITVNFTGCLTERLFNLGYEKLLNNFSELAQRGQIEFVESAAFHSILPLLPEKEIRKQIQINQDINSRRFGSAYKPRGFFIPEMAYADKVAKIIKDLGCEYILLDEISLKPKYGKVNFNVKYNLKNIDLLVIFRNRKISQSFVPETISTLIEQKKILSNYLVTATDGELYGHRYWDWWRKYLKTIRLVSTQTISEYLAGLKKIQTITCRSSSWESTEKELTKNIPYAVWHHPKNKIHKVIWKLTYFALKLNYKNEDDPNHYASRLHLENGLASCTFWWASGRDFKHLFAPIAWHASKIEIGSQELLSSIRSLENVSKKDKLKAEKLFTKIRHLTWTQHWKKK